MKAFTSTASPSDCRPGRQTSHPAAADAAREKKRVEILKALAHPSRLRLIEALAAGPRCVCELHPLAGGALSTVSKHLTVLRQAGLIRDERRGANIFYHLVTPCILKLFECLENARINACQPRNP